jgi:hypothetical protein
MHAPGQEGLFRPEEIKQLQGITTKIRTIGRPRRRKEKHGLRGYMFSTRIPKVGTA